MKVILVALMISCAVVSVRAADIPVVINEEDQAAWAVAGEVMEKCVTGATLRGDASLCRNVWGFINAQAAKVAAQVAAVKKAQGEQAAPKP